jgi:periplasmic protein CpxP/Spy
LSILRFLGAAALAAALVVPVAALAQQAPPAPAAPGAPGQPGMGRHGHRGGFRHALESLNLSAAQKTQIQQILAQARGQNRNADPATRKANREKLRSQIEAVLTPAQRTQFQTVLQQQRRDHQRRGGAWASPAPNATPYH